MNSPGPQWMDSVVTDHSGMRGPEQQLEVWSWSAMSGPGPQWEVWSPKAMECVAFRPQREEGSRTAMGSVVPDANGWSGAAMGSVATDRNDICGPGT